MVTVNLFSERAVTVTQLWNKCLFFGIFLVLNMSYSQDCYNFSYICFHSKSSWVLISTIILRKGSRLFHTHRTGIFQRTKRVSFFLAIRSGSCEEPTSSCRRWIISFLHTYCFPSDFILKISVMLKMATFESSSFSNNFCTEECRQCDLVEFKTQSPDHLSCSMCVVCIKAPSTDGVFWRGLQHFYYCCWAVAVRVYQNKQRKEIKTTTYC